MEQLLGASILDGPLLLSVYLITVSAVLVLLVHRTSVRRMLLTLGIMAAAGLAGWILAWLVSDVWDVFGVSMSTVTRLWTVGVFASLALVVTTLVWGTTWRRVLAVVAVPLFVLSAAAGINVDFGQYTSVRAVLGITSYSSLFPMTRGSYSTGLVGTVSIPPTVSGFAARKALVYVPAAARRPHPVALPVVVMLSGQPGRPEDAFTAGRLAKILDAFAAAHNGLAPIVVVPDQLGAPDRNPMCVDSALGNSATYLTVDVVTWIRAHFTVRTAPTDWAIAGFSQGGTCSIQLGAAHPELFGTVLDISGELVPKTGSIAHTIESGFSGSKAAYAAAAPAAVLAAHAPYTSLHVIFAAGANDAKYLGRARKLQAAATRAGATTELIVSPGTGHDWHTVVYAWTKALPTIAARSGLVKP